MQLPNNIESKLFSFELMKRLREPVSSDIDSLIRANCYSIGGCNPEGKVASSCNWAAFSQSAGDSLSIFSLRRPNLIRGSAAQTSDKS